MLVRLNNIADDSSGTTKYAQYSYLGAGTTYKVEHPAVSNNLVLNYDAGTANTFAGWDRFGRVVDQNWTVNSATVDEYQYGYSASGNRQYRNNTQSTGRSELYAYDNHDRVTNLQRGALNGTDDGAHLGPIRLSFRGMREINARMRWGQGFD